MVDISNIKNVAVIGAGVQGHKIAQVALMAGFDKVILNSRTTQSIERAVEQIINSKSVGLKVLESKGHLKENQTTETLLSKLVKEVDLRKAVEDADFVIECVPEILKLKQEIFKKMGEFSPDHTILASDTSTMSITKIGESSGRSDRVMGMHFFSPMGSTLIEITKGTKTSDKTMDIGYEIAKKLPCERGERMVIRLEKESPGFVVNRVIGTGEIYFKWVIEQATMRGIPYEQVDADVIKLMPMGCCLMCDIMGLDTVNNSMKYFASTLSSDFSPSPVFKNLIDKGHIGKKSGKGFYDWSKGKPVINR
ncbi:MAG: 3-hydroxyacyl-CoA dehydrogenase family protein, partial [Candidatus Lokiarchaeota archaeon]|nr:3-hydroxyacyl-CoA dehydrogenase family protein [Candidatus Lokiarchaeota archaeon]